MADIRYLKGVQATSPVYGRYDFLLVLKMCPDKSSLLSPHQDFRFLHTNKLSDPLQYFTKTVDQLQYGREKDEDSPLQNTHVGTRFLVPIWIIIVGVLSRRDLMELVQHDSHLPGFRP